MKITIANKETINWNKPQLVIHTSGFVIYTSGKHKENTFSGITFNHHQGDLHKTEDSWSKNEFKLYTGKLILEND